LIAATADHQMRRIKARFPEESMLNKAVPFYLYIPDEILQHVPFEYDKNRVGSHKDIMPTLYSYSLSDSAYYSVGGRNMLVVDEATEKAFGYNRAVWITEEGINTLEGDIQFYPWVDEGGLLVQDAPIDRADDLKKIEAFLDLRTWYINCQVRGTR
ncbi:LTA synthase family protein, partial [Thermodesulfobacteriota bacterium]